MHGYGEVDNCIFLGQKSLENYCYLWYTGLGTLAMVGEGGWGSIHAQVFLKNGFLTNFYPLETQKFVATTK